MVLSTSYTMLVLAYARIHDDDAIHCVQHIYTCLPHVLYQHILLMHFLEMPYPLTHKVANW